MKLLYQTHSPFARKVLVLAHEAGLAGGIEIVHHETSPTRRNAEVFAANPLGKVPVLILDDGYALFDSTLICDYLDGLHDRRSFIPASGRARLDVLRLQALAQGICEAGISVRHETVRRPPPYRYAAMREGQTEKLTASYDFLETHAAGFPGGDRFDLGRIALATALDWIAFRGLPDFEAGRPRLSTWYRATIERPSMRATAYEGETQD